MILGSVTIALIAAFFLWVWVREIRPQWREWADIRTAIRRLDIRNGWIVEYGRDRCIVMLHCGHCGHVVPLTDRTGGTVQSGLLVTQITATKKCDHKPERQGA